MLPSELHKKLEIQLSDLTNKSIEIKGCVNIAGGCINDSCRIETNAGFYFLKWNNAMTYPNMFETERDGLIALAKPHCIKIPKVIMQSSAEKFSFLLLEYVDKAERIKNFWEEFGRSLACIHRQSNTKFGWDQNNYIGSLPQFNSWKETWVDFFIEMRLKKQAKMAYDNNLLDDNDLKQLDLLYLQLNKIIPPEEASLIHGDLWSGNFLEDDQGNPCILDPSVYYGHREMDLAMSHLFGGFEQEFYGAYHEVFPMQNGFRDRVDIHNLYPLLVHLNLFGMSYRGSIRSILKRFIL